MGGDGRGYPIQDKTVKDGRSGYPSGKEGYYQVRQDYILPVSVTINSMLKIIQVARDKAALGDDHFKRR